MVEVCLRKESRHPRSVDHPRVLFLLILSLNCFFLLSDFIFMFLCIYYTFGLQFVFPTYITRLHLYFSIYILAFLLTFVVIPTHHAEYIYIPGLSYTFSRTFSQIHGLRVCTCASDLQCCNLRRYDQSTNLLIK